MYIHIEVDRKPQIGNFGNKGGGIKKNIFLSPITYDL